MSEPEEVQAEEVQEYEPPKTPMEEAAAKVKLDDGAAVVFVGVDEMYQNYADPTHMPLNSPSEVQALIDNGTLEVIEVDGESRVTGNVGVLGGQDQVANSDVAPESVVESEEDTEEAHDRDLPPVEDTQVTQPEPVAEPEPVTEPAPESKPAELNF